MNESLLVGSSLVAAVLLTGIVSVLTGSGAVLGLTATGIAIYLAVGIGLPQYLLSRRNGSSVRLGLAALAVGGAVITMVAGLTVGSPNEPVGVGLVPILLVVVVGNVLGAGVREFRAGYRSAP
ncbi:hypothetical protein ACLI4Z_13390 [Natrialbaceae archaeon A-arb3/5]